MALALVVSLGLILRLEAARSWNASRPDAPARLTADEPGYDSLALFLLSKPLEVRVQHLHVFEDRIGAGTRRTVKHHDLLVLVGERGPLR